MLLQLKGNTNPSERFHVKPGIGKLLLMTSPALEEYLDYSNVIENTAPRVRWTVSREDTGRPMIHAQCAKCAQMGHEGNKYFMSGKGAAHEQVFICLHWSEKAPRDVVQVYLDEWKRWTRNAGQPAAPRKFYATTR